MLRVVSVLFVCLCLALPAFAQNRDPEAVRVANQLMDAMGGKAAFDALPMLGFQFAGERNGEQFFVWSHLWNKYTGDYRVEGTTRDGEVVQVILNIHDRGGRAWLNGQLLDGDAALEWVERGYLRFINDSYWALFPWKWLDDGVHLAYEGTQERDGKSYEVVKLTFDDGTGVTSGDRYWGFVDPETHLLARWEFVLQNEDGSPGTDEPTAWAWEDWTEIGGGVKVALTKRKVGAEDGLALTHPRVMLFGPADPAVFEPGGPAFENLVPLAHKP